ncbi:hypothetical protein KDRO_E08880 [Kluyveromyces lactis]|nr:hypothetical protein KDRO_E08880 [Kluyveromyces lactis]
MPTRTLQLSALKSGCRHIDAAAMYGNEAAVGKGIRVFQEKKSSLPPSYGILN